MTAPSTIILLPPDPAAAATNTLQQVHFMDLYFSDASKKIHVLQVIATQDEAF
jgi:hypothetical protein